MKIEIELESVEALRSEIKSLKKENEDLKDSLGKLNEDSLKEQAVDLASKMFGDTMSRVFEELGFDNKRGLQDIDFGNLENYLGIKWWESERLKIEIGATITNEFRGAFIRMGIKTK